MKKGIKNGKKKEKKRITHRTLKRRNEDILDVIYTKKHYIFTLFVVSMFISISTLSLLIIVCFFYTKKKTPIESYWPLSGLSKKKHTLQFRFVSLPYNL